MRLHVIANPLMPTLYRLSLDAHSLMILRFCKLFNKKHEVYFYGCEVNDVECTHMIKVIDSKKYVEHDINFYDPDLLLRKITDKEGEKKIYSIFEENTLKKIKKYYKKGDIICQIWTKYKFNQDMISIDFMNFGGYVSDSYVVFCGYPWYNFQGNMNHENNIIKSRVISPWFNDDEIEYTGDITKYCINIRRYDCFLFLGRLNNYKGFDIYLRLADIFMNYMFYVAGGYTSYDSKNNIITSGDKQYDLNKYKNVRYLGILNNTNKYEILSKAEALICPSRYFEPFGLNAIEAHLCGTPVIASNIGGYTSTIKNNINGFLCNLDSYQVIDNTKDYDGDLSDWINVLKEKRYLRLNKRLIRNDALVNYNSTVAYNNYLDYN